MSHGLRACALRVGVAAMVFVVGTHARAAELWRFPTPPGAAEPSAPFVVVEGKGFYKPFASYLHMPQSLVVATRELDRALGEARAQLPPALQDGFAPSLVVPEHAALSTHTIRLSSSAHFADLVDVDLAWQAAAIVASNPLFVAGSGGVVGAPQIAAQRRLVDFDPVLVSDGGFSLQHNLDQLAISLRTSVAHVVVGRQVISWGTGHLWNPTDLFSPFAPTDVDREVRRGADAVRVSLPLGETSALDLLWLPQQELTDNGGVIRGRTSAFDLDASLSIAKYVSDIVIGADLAGDAGPFGVYGEAAWTQPVETVLSTGSLDDFAANEGFLRAVVGASCRPTEVWTLVAEYYFNGFGTDDPAEYVSKLTSDRLARGEVFGAGMHYVGVTSAWSLLDLTTLSTTAVVNVVDPSVNFVGAIEHSFDQHVLLRAGTSIPLGTGVDTQLFSDLAAGDVLGGSEAFKRATSTFGARSELGLTPLSLFVQLGAYFG